MRVRNQNEYGAALREIDATKKQIGVFETEILKRMEEIEKLETELNEKTPDVERKRGEVDRSLSALGSQPSPEHWSLPVHPATSVPRRRHMTG